MDQAWKSFDTKFLPQWKDWKSSYELGQKPLIFIFQQFFASIIKIYLLGESLSIRLWFYDVGRFSWSFLIS